MYARFHIDYATEWGEQLYLFIGNKPYVGEGLRAGAMLLNSDGRSGWFGQLDANRFVGNAYHYAVIRDGVVARVEWGDGHFIPSLASMSLSPNTPANRVLHIYDGWQTNPVDQPFYSTAFTDSIFTHRRRNGSEAQEPTFHRGQANTLTFLCEAATVRKGMVLAICGNQPALGNWDPTHAAVMDATQQPTWRLSIDRDNLVFPMLYKFVLLDEETHEFIAWEDTPNRYFDPGTLSSGDSVIVRDLYFNSPLHPWRGSGTAIPVFSLRSKTSCGIGDFMDLKLMIDWAEKTGQNVIQLLPINDTTMTRTWKDSYPYNCNSTFALNPSYVRLEAVGTLRDEKERKAYQHQRLMLNRLPSVDYEKVTAVKWDYLHKIYKQQGADDLESEGYRRFYELNAEWLESYALWCYLRDKYKTPDFHLWKESRYEPGLAEKMNLSPAAKKEIQLHKWLQYHLHLQLSEVRDYAHAHGIILKGDIPIGISRCSVDAWATPQLFHMDSQAGAPPDAFDRNGQNWSFPTYNWQEMEREGFRWFRNRFVQMARYFDAYRIDHILGFFRIWEVPENAIQGILGHFNPAMPLSPDDMRNFYGFQFDYERDVLPYVTDDSLDVLFDHDARYIEQQVKRKFLEIPLKKSALPQAPKTPAVRGAYETREENAEPVVEMKTPMEKLTEAASPVNRRYKVTPRFASQRGCQGYFQKRPAEEQVHLKQMFRMLDEVLLVEDPRHRGTFHPRINGMDTLSFQALPPEQQEAYRRMHEDFFYHRHEAFWEESAMKKLPTLVRSTRMLCCGEDLGMIPQCVHKVMSELRILSLEVQRMPKSWDEFGDPASYPYYSVCTTSSHDLSNLRAWWKENPEASQRYYNLMLQCVGDAPKEADGWIVQKIVEQHLCSPAILCILPLQDWLGMDETLRYPVPEDERINLPSNPDNYWHYRMHLNLEDLLKADDFNRLVHDLIKKYDR